MALGVWIVGYLLHMKEYNAMKISELPPLNAWKPGVAVLVLAGLAEIAIFLGLIYIGV
jgi:hypothetical protein